MEKFLSFINEQIEKRNLKVSPLFYENKIYVDKVGHSWLVESVEDGEIVATNQDTDETQTFSVADFAQEVDDVATAEVQAPKQANKIAQAAQNLQKLGLETIAQGQAICDKADVDSVEFKQGQALQTQGKALLKQAEELQAMGEDDEQLTLAQQIQQFNQSKQQIENGQKVVEQAQLLLTDIEDIDAEKVCNQCGIVQKVVSLLDQGCKTIVQGQKCQSKQTLVSQQAENKELSDEICEQFEVLKKQGEKLQQQAEQFVEQCEDKECQAKGSEIVAQAQEIQKQADKIIAQCGQSAILTQDEGNADEKPEQQEQEQEQDVLNDEQTEKTDVPEEKPVDDEEQVDIQAELKQAEDAAQEAQIVQAQDDSEQGKKIAQQLEDVVADIQKAQEIAQEDEFDKNLFEETVEKIKAAINVISEEQEEVEENGEKVLTQSQAVKKIDAQIKTISQACEKLLKR